jgi:hypothetical protein
MDVCFRVSHLSTQISPQNSTSNTHTTDVEILDSYFGNVCELDLIFNFDKAHYILDEMMIAGELQESSKRGRWCERSCVTFICVLIFLLLIR